MSNSINLASKELKTVIVEVLHELKEKPKATLTIEECMAYTGIGRDKLRELANNESSGFPCFRVGVKTLINREMLDNWLSAIASERRVI